MRRSFGVDAVVGAIVVLVLGFTAAAVLPDQPWIEAATWIGALGVAVAATVRRWMEKDEEQITREQLDD